jgi:DNA-binding GntR family transcriptional regulator
VVQLDAGDPSSLGVYAEDAEHARTIREHENVLDAITKGDAVGAEHFVRDHLVDAERHPLLGKRQPVRAAPLLNSFDEA